MCKTFNLHVPESSLHFFWTSSIWPPSYHSREIFKYVLNETCWYQFEWILTKIRYSLDLVTQFLLEQGVAWTLQDVLHSQDLRSSFLVHIFVQIIVFSFHSTPTWLFIICFFFFFLTAWLLFQSSELIWCKNDEKKYESFQLFKRFIEISQVMIVKVMGNEAKWHLYMITEHFYCNVE